MLKRSWEPVDVGSQEPFKLEHGLVVEHDSVDVGRLYAGFFQAVGYGTRGEIRVMFPSAKSLFTAGCHDHAVSQQARCSVMVKAGESQNVHGERLSRKWEDVLV